MSKGLMGATDRFTQTAGRRVCSDRRIFRRQILIGVQSGAKCLHEFRICDESLPLDEFFDAYGKPATRSSAGKKTFRERPAVHYVQKVFKLEWRIPRLPVDGAQDSGEP